MENTGTYHFWVMIMFGELIQLGLFIIIVTRQQELLRKAKGAARRQERYSLNATTGQLMVPALSEAPERAEGVKAMAGWTPEPRGGVPSVIPPDIPLERHPKPQPAQVPPRQAEPPNIKLTPREKLIISLVGQGYSNSEICRSLRLSDNTIRWHMKNIYKKTGAANRHALSALHPQTLE